MDESKLARLRDELEKARKRRDEWDAKVKDLERRYKEAENTCIHNLVHAANLTPEQLAELIRRAATELPGNYPPAGETAEEPYEDEELFDDPEDEKEAFDR